MGLRLGCRRAPTRKPARGASKSELAEKVSDPFVEELVQEAISALFGEFSENSGIMHRYRPGWSHHWRTVRWMPYETVNRLGVAASGPGRAFEANFYARIERVSMTCKWWLRFTDVPAYPRLEESA